ncbi:hypothetical protein [Pseudomonas soli]|uniref:hypothetical protein n=1 Tax=Pseudomonas soli TaxID=1306993 RepID=UPI002896173D|nr:hypothetical protein [Pseudomonas soli]MDT3717346.1 hypothetical protein [Pseudomonas soli]MDT3734078.1 hypothetical protein [Pseudomonas soli]
MKGINKKLCKSASLIAILASCIGFFSDVGGVWSLVKDLKQDEEPLVVIQGRLTPVFRNPGFSSNHDDASLSIQIRNYSEKPVTLISAYLSVQDAKNLAVAKSGGKGRCTLGPKRNENNPITIAPGATQWLTVGSNVELKGVSSYLTEEKLADVFVHDTNGAPFSIAQLSYVDELNAYFDKVYGKKAKIKVILKSILNAEHVFSFQ